MVLAPLDSAELYDPVIGAWNLTGRLGAASVGPQIALLPNGQALRAGGQGVGRLLDNAERYNPDTGRWSAAGKLQQARAGHGMARLKNGGVLVVGGAGNDGVTLGSGEIYDPVTDVWSAAGNLNEARGAATTTVLPDGRVLVAAGINGVSNLLNSAEVFTGVAAVTGGSAASYDGSAVAAESIVAAFGANLSAGTTLANTLPLPTRLNDVAVKVKDSAGTERAAPLFFVSPGQINFLLPPDTSIGLARLTVTSNDVLVGSGIIQIAAVAPGLFAANGNGQGVAAAVAVRVRADASQSYEPVARFDAGLNRFVPIPLDPGAANEQLILALYGTGFRARSSLAAATVKIGGFDAEVLYAGPAPGLIGLDQLNVRLPRGLIGRGEVTLTPTVDGKTANAVIVSIQ